MPVVYTNVPSYLRLWDVWTGFQVFPLKAEGFRILWGSKASSDGLNWKLAADSSETEAKEMQPSESLSSSGSLWKAAVSKHAVLQSPVGVFTFRVCVFWVYLSDELMYSINSQCMFQMYNTIHYVKVDINIFILVELAIFRLQNDLTMYPLLLAHYLNCLVSRPTFSFVSRLCNTLANYFNCISHYF